MAPADVISCDRLPFGEELRVHETGWFAGCEKRDGSSELMPRKALVYQLA